MSRHRVYFEWELPAGVVEVVRAICLDYKRRSLVLAQNTASDKVRKMYTELNAAIDNALLEIEPGVREFVLDDIARKRGYDFSKTSPYFAKNTYYRRKRKLVYDIARLLSLVE